MKSNKTYFTKDAILSILTTLRQIFPISSSETQENHQILSKIPFLPFEPIVCYYRLTFMIEQVKEALNGFLSQVRNTMNAPNGPQNALPVIS